MWCKVFVVVSEVKIFLCPTSTYETLSTELVLVLFHRASTLIINHYFYKVFETYFGNFIILLLVRVILS